MNSTTSLIAKQYRLSQWAEQIRDCQNRPDGMPVSEWCTQSIVPVPQETLAPTAEPLPVLGLDISVNGFCIHVTESTSPELLVRVLRVAAHAQ